MAFSTHKVDLTGLASNKKHSRPSSLKLNTEATLSEQPTIYPLIILPPRVQYFIILFIPK
jgi:hypothetical protein